MIRIAYFGLPLAALLLERDGFSPAFAVLAPTEAPGRRRLRRLLGDRLLDAREWEGEETLEEAVSARLVKDPVDLVVSWYWTRRLSARVLDGARLGGVGVHPSLLPRHRGPNPFFATIDAGDALTGVTVHRLTPAYDDGDVVLQEPLEVDERDSWELARALDRPSLRALRRVVRTLGRGEPVARTAQDETLATWAPEPEGELLAVDWTWTTERVLRRIRALSPVPGLAIEIRGTPLFVIGARATTDFPLTLVPGEAAVTSAGVVIRTGDQGILLTRVQMPVDEEDLGDQVREIRGPQIADSVGFREKAS